MKVVITAIKEGKPVYYVLRVDKEDGSAPYIVQKRYNDFIALAKDFEDEMGEPVAVIPPPKPGLFEKVNLEQRKVQLEQVIQALVRVPNYAQSFAVGNFLDLYQKRDRDPSEIDYLRTSTEVSKLLNNAKQSGLDMLKTRQLCAQAKSLITNLQLSLSSEDSNKSGANSKQKLSTAERQRRQQQVDDFLQSLQSIEVKLTKMGSLVPQPQSRVLGETSSTVNLNNRQLMMSQQQSMESQDEVIEYLRKTVARQKELGMEIHDELSRQNELLEELDHEVNQVNAKLNFARKKTDQLSR